MLAVGYGHNNSSSERTDIAEEYVVMNKWSVEDAYMASGVHNAQ